MTTLDTFVFLFFQPTLLVERKWAKSDWLESFSFKQNKISR